MNPIIRIPNWLVVGLLFWNTTAFAFYNPAAGRWLNRDPIGERGGINIYAFVANDSANQLDLLGLDINVVSTATCDFCSGGPILGPTATTLRAWRWHVWGRSWQDNTIQIFIPGTDIAITGPYHIPLSGGYWVIFGGWVVVDATCGIPKNAWTLIDFEVTSWPTIGPNMQPSVKCKYACNYNPSKRATLQGSGATALPPIQREGNSTEEMGPPPVYW